MSVGKFIVCVVFLSTTSSALDPHQLELKQHYEHLAYIADFPCLHPQPQVISVHKLFSEAHTHDKAYYPDVTVLHRCDENAGSCTSGHACSAKTSAHVLLPFKATYLHDVGQNKKGSWKMEYHELLNHTECACIEPPSHDSSQDNIVVSPSKQDEGPASSSALDGDSSPSSPSVVDTDDTSSKPDGDSSPSSSPVVDTDDTSSKPDGDSSPSSPSVMDTDDTSSKLDGDSESSDDFLRIGAARNK